MDALSKSIRVIQLYDVYQELLTKKQKAEIEKSLKKFNLVEIPAINKDNSIIAGHQRINILYELNGGDYEIDVRVPDVQLSDKDFKEYFALEIQVLERMMIEATGNDRFDRFMVRLDKVLKKS